ncbi:hypothetical protein Tco_1373700, partial [Tanacetum coccineum]
EEKIKVAIHPEYPEQTIAIGSTLTKKGRKELCTLLGQNLDVFAWKPADMTGVPRHAAEHRLNVREGCLPIRQKKRGQAPERNKAIQEEVEKLVDARIMKEVHYHSWLSNQACPQDGYPLLEIDWKVESLCGYPFKCFLDAYKGYHQIKIAKEDEEKKHIYHKSRDILLFKDVIWFKKCQSDLSAFGRQGIPKTDRAQPGGGRSSLQTNEEAHRRTPNANRTGGRNK